MLTQKIIQVFCLIFFLSSGLRAQQQATPRSKPAGSGSRAPQPVPPPKPADKGPSLEVTMKFIQEKLSEMGPVTYSVSTHSESFDTDPVTWREEYSNVVADTQGCAISYREQFTQGSKQPENFTYSLNLKEVKKIKVQSLEQFKNDLAAKTGGPAGYTIRPPVFMVIVEPHWLGFNVDDEELANRLARALLHAVELCTPDKKAEPF